MPIGDHESDETNVLHMGPVIVTCPECDNDQEEMFTAEAIDVEQLRDPPEKDCTCERCSHVWHQVYPGFVQYGYA